MKANGSQSEMQGVINALCLSVTLLASPTRSVARTELTGTVGVEALEYGLNKPQVRSSETWILPSSEVFAKFGDNEQWRFKAGFHGQLLVASRDPHPASAPSDLNQTGSPQFLEEKDTYFEFRHRRAQVTLGSQILRWGVSDIYDPLDQINARRFERPLDTTKRSEWMARASSTLLQRSSWSISTEAVWIPVKKAPLLPSTSSAWLPREVYIPQGSQDAILEMPDVINYSYRARQVFNRALENAFGLRIQFKSERSEWSLQYDEGAQGFPAVQVTATGQLLAVSPRPRVRVDSSVELEEQLNRERRYGLSLVRQLRLFGNDWILRAQGARTEAVDAGRPNSGQAISAAEARTDWMLAAERTFSSRWLGPITGLIQVFYNSNALEAGQGGNDATSTNRLFDRALSMGARIGITDFTSLTIGGIASQRDQVLQFSASTALTDQLQLDLNYSLIQANLESTLGSYRNNDSLAAKLSAFF